jgi:hypothetical protein
MMSPSSRLANYKVTPRVRCALLDSIAHWYRLSTGTAHRGEDVGADYCALCHLFNHDEMRKSKQCLKCPIYADTGKRYCEGTPYTDGVAGDTPTSRARMLMYLVNLAGRLGIEVRL